MLKIEARKRGFVFAVQRCSNSISSQFPQVTEKAGKKTGIINAEFSVSFRHK